MQQIFAYFDPGSGSLMVQIIAGGSAGFVVLMKMLWDGFKGEIHRSASAISESRVVDASNTVVETFRTMRDEELCKSHPVLDQISA